MKFNSGDGVFTFEANNIANSLYISGSGVGIGTATIPNPNSLDKVLVIGSAGPVGLVLNDSRDASPIGLENRGAVFHLTYGTSNILVADGASANVTVSTGNLVIGTAGKGIDFSTATPDGAGMTSELLDDYEEGTWTPVFTGCTFTGTYTATYTKIGRKVTVQLSFVNQSISSVTDTAQIGGLPFTSTNAYQAGSITYADILTTAGSVYVQNSNTNLYFIQNTGTTAADWNAGTSNRSLMLTATYFV
jgi:hypothetical protein